MHHLLFRPVFTILLVFFLIALPGFVAAQAFFEFPPASPFNAKVVQPPDSAWSYSFLVGGHLYGSHSNAHSLFPAASFLGNFKRLNANPVEMLISLGDLIRNSGDPKIMEATRRALAGLDLPVFNAPGNHDLIDRVAYEKAFGNNRTAFFAKTGDATTHFGFFIKDDYYLILDSELLLEDGTDQVQSFLDKELNRVKTRKVKPRNIFVFSHRLLWVLCADKFAAADGLANEPLAGKVDRESTCALVAQIEGMPRERELFWFSGDVGSDWSVPLIYAQDASKKAHYIATGIGDQPDDALVQVTVSREGQARLKVFPLTDQKWEAVAHYDLAYWAGQPRPESAGGNGVADKVSMVLSGKAIWIGIFAGLLLGIIGAGVLRKSGK